MPSVVKNIACKGYGGQIPHIHCQWDMPTNLPFIARLDAPDAAIYKIQIQKIGEVSFMQYSVLETSITIKDKISFGAQYYVWIRCVLLDVKGVMSQPTFVAVS